MPETPPERRKAPRITALLKVEYETLEEVQSDYLTDLSEGGLFVRSSVPLAIGQEIEFTLSFPGLLNPLVVRGAVRSKTSKSVNDAREEGYGVEFVFADDVERERVRALVQRLQTPAAADGQVFRILLVDDNRVVRDLFKHALQRLRAEDSGGKHPEIVVAADGRTAWKMLEAQKIDLLILDHYLAELNGIELLRMIRADPRFGTLPVVMISSNEKQLKGKALLNGADLFVSKPVQARTLLTTLRGLIKSVAGT